MSLTGIWKQGSPMPLNFTRSAGTGGAASISAGTATIGAPLPPAITATANPARGLPAASCGSMVNVNYWDGSAWKPMVIAAHLGGEKGASVSEGLKALGRNPFNSRAGLTNILTFKNPEATLTLEPSPRFCIQIPANYDPTIVKIGVVDVKKDHRELETCAGACASKGRTTDDWMPEKRVQPVDVKRISDTLVEITPKNPLNAGQYILGGPPLVGYFDFGVKAGNAGQ
jgi:hypothetical protein